MRDFPPELWARIASFSRRADLLNLALTSSTHLATARRVFCRSVMMSRVHGSDVHASDEILNYLVKYNMTSIVREIMVFAYKLGNDALRTIIACPNLRSLTFVVCGKNLILKSAATQKQFVKELKESCTHLEEFRFNCDVHVRHYDFSIPNLKVLRWKERGKLSRSLISLCEASLSTLTDISVTVYDGYFAKFFQLRFPNLVAFRVGPGHEHFEVKEALLVGSALTGFLMAHSEIKHLDLVYSTSTMLNSDTTYVPIDPKVLSPDILPLLRFLKAHPSQVCSFLSAQARSFKILSSLHLTSWDSDGLMISKLLEYANANGPCSLVNELFAQRNTFYQSSSKSFDAYIEHVATVFPNLERWRGDVPQPFNAGSVAKSLSRFPLLRRIAVIDTDRQATPITARNAKSLALILPLLESVESYGSRANFRVSRDTEENRVVITSRTLLTPREQSGDFYEDSISDADCADSDEYYSSEDSDGSGQEDDEDEEDGDYKDKDGVEDA